MGIEIKLNGESVRVPENLTVAGAMFYLGRRVWRKTARYAAPRSWFCGMGVCHECRMCIDGRPNTRACSTWVRAGMSVETQVGEAGMERAR